MYYDVIMPLTLFIVTMIAMFLSRKVEGKLKGVLEEKEFRIRDAILLVASVTVTVSLVVFIPQSAVMIVFLFSYSILLFMFGYLFSGLRKKQVESILTAFIAIGILAGVANPLILNVTDNMMYGALAFSSLCIFAFASLLYETKRKGDGERWFLAVLPPALFIGLYAFYSRSPIWFPYMLDLYGAIFAVLIILYLSSMFKWNITLLFVTLLTIMDIILVLFTGSMVSAARSVAALRLPVMISLPTVPAIMSDEGNRLYMSLGLGDFFFAGLLTIQMLKRYGGRFAVSGAVGMVLSFFLFEAYILTFNVSAFPGTLMIICGWLPIVLAAEAARRLAPHSKSLPASVEK